MDKSVLVVCGQTATGKTAAAIKLAQDYGGEVISVDSRQVYKHLDIGTGKDLPTPAHFELVTRETLANQTYDIGFYSYGGTKLWLYDCLKPDQQINIAHTAILARKLIGKLHTTCRLPILVGGDGYYLKNVIDPAETLLTPPNPVLRAELEKEPVSILQKRLEHLQPNKWQIMNQSDRSNPRRLIRAIEVAAGKSGPRLEELDPKPDWRVCWIGLQLPPDKLYERIADRVHQRVNQGFAQEINKLLALYPGFFSLPAAKTLGYSQWQAVLAETATEKEAIDHWIQAEINYAKSQKTWFKKRSEITWFDIQSNSWYAQAREQVNKRRMGHHYAGKNAQN